VNCFLTALEVAFNFEGECAKSLKMEQLEF